MLGAIRPGLIARIKLAQAINLLAEIGKAIERRCSYIPLVLGALAQAIL
jgi:hypothetical protein